VLNQQPIPYGFDEASGNNIPQSPGNLGNYSKPNVVLRPENGALPVMVGAYSPARVKYDGMKGGIVSRDAILNNKEDILKFFNFHGVTRPTVFIVVEGYHHETYTTTSTDANGRTRTQTNRRKVTDFEYTVDISGFIYPFGKISMEVNEETKDKSVELLIEEYLADRNKLKSLQLKKKLCWDTNFLCDLIRRYIRSLGWRRDLSVTKRTRNTSVRIAVNSKLARMYDSRGGRALMIITIIPAIATAVYAHGHRKRSLRSVFTIQYTPYQVFEMIRPQLWCPTYGGGCCIQ